MQRIQPGDGMQKQVIQMCGDWLLEFGVPPAFRVWRCSGWLISLSMVCMMLRLYLDGSET